VTDNNQKPRFYEITPAGRRQLATEITEWDRIVSINHAYLRSRD
jgi:DNA-binding PadR family transcriptional regulator